jgi:DNA-nicking Smr family endonuclease
VTRRSDEEDLRKRYLAGVRPLSARTRRVAAPGPPKGPSRPPLVSAPRFEIDDDGQTLEGRRADLPPRWIERLRKGVIFVQARLDLHGLTASEADASVRAFIERAQAEGLATVLVIHGKGMHSPAGQPVLRGEIGGFLTSGSTALKVLGFVTARPEDGGAGALYVALAPRAPPGSFP